MALVNPKWTCEKCNTSEPVVGESVLALEHAKRLLKAGCKRRGHDPAVYYTAGVRL